MVDYNQLNKRLFPYAYNILGNTSDSEDVVQDVLIKMNGRKLSSIADNEAYLIKFVINQFIDLKK